jgi:hypothetical protein
MGKRDTNRVLMGELKGRLRCKWEDNIKTEVVNWIQLTRMGTMGNFFEHDDGPSISIRAEDLLASTETINSSRMTVLYGLR